MKVFTLFLLLSLAWAFVPYPLSYVGSEQQAGDLVITGQACGCPCPQARILEGKLSIPDSILHANPQIYRTQMNLEGNTPFVPFVYELAISRIKLKGQVVGMDTILCTQTGCELAPLYRVDSWEALDYIPRISTWERWQYRLYLLLFIFSVGLAIVQFFPKLIRFFTKLKLEKWF